MWRWGVWVVWIHVGSPTPKSVCGGGGTGSGFAPLALASPFCAELVRVTCRPGARARFELLPVIPPSSALASALASLKPGEAEGGR